MWLFLMSPLGRRIGLAAGAVVLLGLALRWYGNRQYAQGRQEEKTVAVESIAKAATEARDAARLELQQERDQVAQESAKNAAARSQFERDRKGADATMRARLSAIVTATQEGKTRVLETSDSGLADLIRDLNRELEPVAPNF